MLCPDPGRAADSVSERKTFEHVPGLWRFEAVAAEGSTGSLYVELGDCQARIARP